MSDEAQTAQPVDTHKETLGFQTEVKQLLHLMIHSLYSNREIFLRELISNAADASDKLRFEALSDDALYEGETEQKVWIDLDKDAGTVTIRDNGIGMNRDEVMANLGTIAKSGTAEFVGSLTGDESKDASLIGQFGVGFYSAFIVADKVTVRTRRAGTGTEHGVMWESAGEGDYSIETIEQPKHGTEVILHLREDASEFLDNFRLREIVRKYSDHIPLPIMMMSEPPPPMPPAEGEEPAPEEVPVEEVVNKASALWARPRKDVKEDEYKEFYKYVSHDWTDPLDWVHSQVEGKYEYSLLLYVPGKAPFDLWDRDARHGVKLYVRRVFIMDDAEQLLPSYLRFIRGVVDSDDLPLNVSREILQGSKVVDALRNGAINKVLGMLEKLSKDDEKYPEFWKEFGNVLKEGPGEDFANKERIAKLLRFVSTSSAGEATVSLQAYVERMQEGQSKIYYVTAETLKAAENSPHLELFRKKNIEVLLLADRVDEWLVSHLTEFDGKTLHSVAKGAVDLDELADEEEKKEQEKVADDNKDLVERIKTTLGDKVKEVRVSSRLTDSAACLVADENELSGNLERMLKAAGQDVPDTAPILEINAEHPLVTRMGDEQDQTRFDEWTLLLFDQALLSEGGQLEDPASFVKRLNGLLVEMNA